MEGTGPLGIAILGKKVESMSTSTQPKNYALEVSSTDLNSLLKLGLMNSTSVPPKESYGICIPSGLDDPEVYEKIFATLMNYMNQGFGSYIGDIADAWVVLVIMAVLVVVITFVYIQLLQCITKPILYGSLLMITILLLACDYFTFDNM